MLKICGITFDHTTNYGSCFQAYALERAIERTKIGGEHCKYYLIPIKKFKEFPVKNRLFYIVSKPLLEFHRLQFKGFERKNVSFVSIDSTDELSKLNDEMDVFVCGSDVIWNPDFNMNIDAFFLDFAKKYKFSYAASFGKLEIPKSMYNNIRTHLESFNSISVREKTGADIVKECTGKNVKVVGDPVLLLNRKEWEMIIDNRKHNNRKNYIFVYATHINSTIISFINKLVKQTGLKVIYSTCGPRQAIKLGILQVQKPCKWLQLLRDAEYVVTNSFHATVFSVLFHKKFFSVAHGDSAKGIYVRLNDFLNDIGLVDRLFDSVPSIISEELIDYSAIDSRVERIREDSYRFLCDNLNRAFTVKQQENSDNGELNEKYYCC